MINSTSNKQIKNIIQLQTKAKARKEQGVFIVEGIKMYREVPRDRLIGTYVSESFYEKARNKGWLDECDFEIVSDRVFAAASDTKTPQGILCLVKQREYSLTEVLKGESPLLLLLEDIQDPGNLGTILRTAEASGVTGILMSRGTVDIYNPKTIRSTMGSVYRMPFCAVKEWTSVIRELEERHIRTFAAHLQGESEYTSQDYKTGCAFMIGNESSGLSEELARQADTYIKISMSGQVESLNAAVAAAVLMFEARRQRNK